MAMKKQNSGSYGGVQLSVRGKTGNSDHQINEGDARVHRREREMHRLQQLGGMDLPSPLKKGLKELSRNLPCRHTRPHDQRAFQTIKRRRETSLHYGVQSPQRRNLGDKLKKKSARSRVIPKVSLVGGGGLKGKDFIRGKKNKSGRRRAI